jgi:DNA polymerase-1
MENSMSETPRLFLIDAMPLLYRGHFIFLRNPRTNSDGDNTSALFGYLNSLLQIIEKEKPTHIAVAFDTPEPTFRHEMYPEYKAQREAMPEGIGWAIPRAKELTKAMNVSLLELPGYEADDIIGTFARMAERSGMETYMVTPDKDYTQLVSKTTYLYRPGKGGDSAEIMGIPEVLGKYGLDRVDQVIDMLGLAGDTADNIPGVPGIGEKTAAKLLRTFGDVENLLAHTDQLKGKQREKVEANADKARLSKTLATINCEVPIDLSLETFLLGDYKSDALERMIREHEFTGIGKRLFGGAFSVASPMGDLFDGVDDTPAFATIKDTAHDYHLVDQPDAQAKLAASLMDLDRFCFDTETTSLDTQEAELVGVALSWEPGVAYYCPAQDEQDARRLLALLQPALTSPTIEKIGHNLKYDISVLRRYDVAVSGPIFDTMLAHYVVDPVQRHGMDALARTYLKYEPVSIEALIGPKGKDQGSIADAPLAEVAEYAAEDADVTLRLYDILKKKVTDEDATRALNECENPLINVLVDMEHEGIRIDDVALKAFSIRLGADIERLEAEIYECAGTEFNIASPKQLGEILFDRLQVEEKPKKTKTGQYATNEEILTRLAFDHDIASKVLEFRGCQKLKSTYVDTLPLAIRESTGRVHTSYNQAVTATGRLQSNNPNLQNIPIRTERGREIRRAFVPRDADHLLLSADYSQIELRVMAEISGDAALRQTFKDGVDVHRATAARVNGVDLDGVTEDMRRHAKMVNFGIIYGISAFGLSQRLRIPRAQAAAIIDAYFEEFPGVKGYMDTTIAYAVDKGYVQTLMGRRRYLPDIHSRNATTRHSAERNAINTPIQGTAADMIKLAMIRIHHALNDAGLKTRMLLQVHDELVFDLLRTEEDQVRDIVRDGMQNAIKTEVPIVVDMDTGDNWLQAH